MPSLFIRNATIVTMDDDRNIFEGSLLIGGGLIMRVIEGITTDDNLARLALPPTTEIIDASGLIVMPGMINTHGHAAMTLFRGFADDLPLQEWLEEKIWPLENLLTAEDIFWGTMLGIAEMIRSGTTTFTDMYFSMDQVARAVEITGIRAVLAHGIVGTSGRLEKDLYDTEKLVENWHGGAGGRITVTLGPHAPYTCPPESLKRIIALAEKVNLPIQIHMSESRLEIENCLKEHGVTPVELVDRVGLFEGRKVICAHCVHLRNHDIDILAARKAGVAHNPTSNLKLGSGIAPVMGMLQAGIKVGIGTDGAASNNNLDMFEEMRLAALLPKGLEENPSLLPAAKALQLATTNGAEILFLPKTGVIEEGYRADIIGITRDLPHLQPPHDVEAHLVYSASGSDVELSIVDGRILMKEGKLVTMDEERIFFETDRRARRLATDN